jgi:SnoaL-like domain
MTNFEGLDADDARRFSDLWLPAWTGNRPEYLLSFYTEDAFYSDPAIPNGVRGQRALLAYFTKLLSRFPDWIWTHRGSQPLKDGFLNGWHASIAVGGRVVEIDGVCSVQLRGGLIYRNVVYFDRSELLAALAKKPRSSWRGREAGSPA